MIYGKGSVGRCARGLVLALLALFALTAGTASAVADPADNLTYMPYQDVHGSWSASQVDGFLSELDSYGIGQALQQMPKFKQSGIAKLPKKNKTMLSLWSARAASYDAEHGTDISVTAVFNGDLDRKTSPNLEDPATRANMIASIEAVLATGVSGVQLDIEPFRARPGLIALLEELDSVLPRAGFTGRLSLAAPANIGNWPPSYLAGVSALVNQIDPLFYESETRTPATYEAWVRNGLAYYSANVAPATRIVPVIPSYPGNRWHLTNAENIETGTIALDEALGAGTRVNGAGIWWWYGFYEDEAGSFDASPDRAAWLSSTLSLPFTP